MRPAEDIKRLVKGAQVTINQDVRREALNELVCELERSETICSADTVPSLWRDIMKHQMIKLAAVAAVLIGVLMVINNMDPASVALADVLKKIEQVKAYQYKIEMKVSGDMMSKISPWGQDMTGTVTVSETFGIKTEMKLTDPDTGVVTAQENYILPEDKLFVEIHHEQKRFTRSEFSEDLLARMKEQHNDPRELIRQMLSVKYTELGQSKIEGIEVVGFETTDPSISSSTGDARVILWVDSVSWLPVMVDMNMNIDAQGRIQSQYYDYQWDVPVTKSDFTPNIPDEYEAGPGDGMEWPEMTEEAAIEGLKLVVDLLGRYPKQISIVELMQEISPVLFKQIKKALPKDATDTQLETKMLEAITPIQSSGLFYMTLVEDQKQPIYFGETVKPGNREAVLLRWKSSDNEYRVIFGDLSAKTITTEQLSEIEK